MYNRVIILVKYHIYNYDQATNTKNILSTYFLTTRVAHFLFSSRRLASTLLQCLAIMMTATLILRKPFLVRNPLNLAWIVVASSCFRDWKSSSVAKSTFGRRMKILELKFERMQQGIFPLVPGSNNQLATIISLLCTNR